MLGLIYHALGTIATHHRGPGLANAHLPIHYVLGWLGEHFPDLTTRRCDSDFPEHYPLLARYSQIEAKFVSPNQARIIFRSELVVYRPSVFLAHEDLIILDTETLVDNAFEYLICMRSALLPVRVGGHLWLEPYYPNRFARQFGFDQGVPANKLLFSVCERQRCGIEKLAIAQAVLLRKDTTTRFYIPRSTRIGECSWWYCRWWMTACAPYMGFSVSKIYSVVDKRTPRRDNVFVTDNLKNISTGINRRGFNAASPSHGASSSRRHKKRTRNAIRPNVGHSPRVDRDSHLKRARHDNHNMVEVESSNYVPEEDSSNPVQGEIRHDDVVFPREMESIHVDNPAFENIYSYEGGNILQESANSQTGESFETESVSVPQVETQTGGSFEPESVSVPQIEESDMQQIENNPTGNQSPEGLVSPAAMEPGNQSPEGLVPPAAVEPPQNLVSIENFVCRVLGAQVNKSRREFITREIEAVFSLLYSSETPAQLLMHHSEVHKTLGLLWSMVDILGCGEVEFKQFAGCVDRIFELALRHSQSSAYIEALGDVNVDLIHDLIRQHEECLTTKQTIEAQLAKAAKEFDDLDVKEATIREAEERVRQMREEHEATKTSLIMQKMNLEVSLESQDEQAAQLQQSRIDAKEELLPKIGSTRLSMRAQEKEIHQLVNALFSSCCEP